MADPEEKAAWVRRVLGVDIGVAGGGSPSGRRGEEAKTLNVRGIAYPKLRPRSENAQSSAISALQRAGQAYLALPNVQADPRYSEAQKAIGGLPQLIPALGSELRDLLDRGVNAGSDADIAADALNVVDDYREALAAAGTLQAFEGFARKYVGELSAIGTLGAALGEIAQSLEAAV